MQTNNVLECINIIHLIKKRDNQCFEFLGQSWFKKCQWIFKIQQRFISTWLCIRSFKSKSATLFIPWWIMKKKMNLVCFIVLILFLLFVNERKKNQKFYWKEEINLDAIKKYFHALILDNNKKEWNASTSTNSVARFSWCRKIFACSSFCLSTF
jgi:hypothetical protein